MYKMSTVLRIYYKIKLKKYRNIQKIMRIDKFLKLSRIIKRRTVAQDACDGGRIEINGRDAKPSKDVKVGDIVVVHFGSDTVKIRVLATPDVANKASATDLYEVIED